MFERQSGRCWSSCWNHCHQHREADRSVSNRRRHTERSHGKMGTAGRGINKNANRVENERKVPVKPRTQIVGQIESGHKKEREEIYLRSVQPSWKYRTCTRLERKMEQHRSLALLSETDTVFTASHYHMLIMLTSGRASALVQVAEPGNDLAAGRILA